MTCSSSSMSRSVGLLLGGKRAFCGGFPVRSLQPAAMVHAGKGVMRLGYRLMSGDGTSDRTRKEVVDA